MGLDLYFYKFDPQGTERIRYVPWMGDRYTEVDIDCYYDWKLFKYLHPDFDIKDYNWRSFSSYVNDDVVQFIGRDKENGNNYNHYRNKKTKETICIEDEYIPTYTKPYLKTFVKEVFYVRKGYGAQAIGMKPEPGEMSVNKMWALFKKDTKRWQPTRESAPLIPKKEWINLITKPEYNWLLNHINNFYGGAKYNGVRKLDYDLIKISY